MAVNCADDPDRPTAKQITDDLENLRAAYEEASPCSAGTGWPRC